MNVIDFIPIELDAIELLCTMRMGRLKEEDVASVIEKYRILIEPKALYDFSNVVGIEKDRIRLKSGHTLKSIILSDLLECDQTIVPYVVTIGPKLEKQASEEAKSSVLRAWILNCIGDYALGRAATYLRNNIEKTLDGVVSSFGPGTGTGKLFSIEQLEIIFQILNPTKNIGVSLMPSYLMMPRKSISGVFTATSKEYVACQYCPREECENRKKPYSGEYSPTEQSHED